MSIFKQFVLECDLFAHNSLQRYKQEQGYRTLVGGIVSIILIVLFVIVFFNLVINTFAMSIVTSQQSTVYDDDPTYSQLNVNPAKNYMFAIGITGIDLSSSSRYFDITFTNRTSIKNGTTTLKTTTTIPLSPCNITQFSGISNSITKSFVTQNFSQWLCPPTGTVLPVQGKFTSQTFKYAQLVISQCTNNPLYPGTTCKTSQDISTFITDNGQFIANIYFINPVINPADNNYITYYLQDSNYFAFDTSKGTQANIFHSDYTVTSDNTILPWNEKKDVTGTQVVQTAVSQSFQVQSNNQYFKFYWRKSASKAQIARSFQKLDQTLSYIGGLFGTIILLLISLKFYSKYSYELDIADKTFKQNNGGSFGSENFNFIVFLGYMFFNMFTKFGVILNWKQMKKYHRCRQECQRQLNIDLLLKKISHFEEISKIVLDQHHIKTLLMIPKPTIKEAKLNRKRFLMKSIIYHQLQRKGRDYWIEKQDSKERFRQFLKQERDQNYKEILRNEQEQLNDSSLKAMQDDFVDSYKKIESQKNYQASHSRKISDRLKSDDLFKVTIDYMLNKRETQQVMKRSHIVNRGLQIELIPSSGNIMSEQDKWIRKNEQRAKSHAKLVKSDSLPQQ